jgi:hypothetical protein
VIKTEISGNGFTIELLGRAGLKYTEGSMVVFVDGEVLVGSSDYVVYENGMGPWDGYVDASAPLVPSDKDPRRLPEHERKRIIVNIKAAFTANGMVLEVE